jgi:lipopolysaccharide transport system ATP-binding protein
MSDIAIAVRGVAKRYQVFDSPWERLRHALWSSRHGVGEIQALDDVSFEVRRGESIALIGRNGSGKSTLLEIITGTLAASAGQVEVKGRVCALLELGSGFNPEYTGRDNVMMNGLLAGFDRAQILARFGEIEAFAEIGDAIDRPVKTYSSGMMMRLAFAVQVLSDPDILIIDEALSVGDFFFQQKCFAHIRAMRERGVTLVFVSHDMGTVRDLCDRAVYLKSGRARFIGETREAIRQYLAERTGHTSPPAGVPQTVTATRDDLQEVIRDAAWTSGAGASPGRLIAVAVYDDKGEPSMSFRLGEFMRVKIAYRPAATLTHVGFVMRNKLDQVVTSTGSSRLGLEPPQSAGPAIFELRIELRLEAGNYSVAAALGNWIAPNLGENIDFSGPIGPIAIQWDYEKDLAPFLGMFGPPAEGAFTEIAEAPAEAAR